MAVSRRRLAALAGAALLPMPALLSSGLPTAARAQEAGGYPNRPIRLVVAFAAGGNSDTLARLLQPRLAAVLGQGIVIDNRGGAAGTLAAAAVASAPADGYTLLFDAASFVVAQFVHRSTPFSYERDFAPVGMVAEVPYILAVPAGSAARDLPGFLAAAKAGRDGIAYGSPGVGSIGHLAGALLAHRTGAKLEHVPYRGGSEVARDLAAGTLEAGILSTNSLSPVIESGKARALAVTSARRGGIPGVPTIAESGVPGFDLTSWNAIFCRAGTPEPALRRLEAAIDAATADPEVRARFAAIGAEATPAEPRKLGERVAREREMVAQLIRDTGITLG
ncbi:tripartite tricarboxylate transporter substrate-binding protein [Roseomonas sp. NAR14]|uniref:Tripartite tricarboxylate transporter substrate-binding protein n=1 Tax=Roseomonas acroporae TaxID=2937791 RepID=A0A9X1YK35_9PROT|nr:tripartite tricarboxylate transporter substrate-binding protein [Roseomonas acroporae]MCK8787531.1 tripartite tricarboxylate transporter substrate-binding protein [Roseomonas acroporae]